MSYRPEAVHPRPRVLDRVDRGDYIRERLNFWTTTDVEVPCYFLIPKRAKFPVPAVVALHDHGGFYYWGKEKLVETDDEHPMLATYRKEYYDGASFPVTLAQRGYAVIVIDMFYHGERRLILDEDLENRTNDRSKAEPEEIIATCSRLTVDWTTAATVASALGKARANALDETLIVVTGSIYIVGETLQILDGT